MKVAAKNKGAAENEISDNKEEILSDPGTGVNSDEEEETVIQSDDKPKVLGQVECESNDDISSQDESNIDKKEVIEKPGNDCENGAEQGSNVLKSGVNSGENSNRKEETPIQTPENGDTRIISEHVIEGVENGSNKCQEKNNHNRENCKETGDDVKSLTLSKMCTKWQEQIS